MQEIQEPVEAEFSAVNRLIVENLESDVALIKDIGHHIVAAGGKRLRPLLTLLSARCCGYTGEEHIRFAAVVEFIHTATLLHDDVVDLSTLRRGRPTANTQFGNAASVLVGDFLYTRAFQLMVELGNIDLMQNMARTTNSIAEGEVLQLTRAGDASVVESQYLDVVTRKTATLFASACYGAGAIAAADAARRKVLYEFGLNTGIAFQIFDDVLDYSGNPAKLGKNVGDDLREGKLTLPTIQLLRTCGGQQRAILERAIAGQDTGQTEAVVAAVQSSGALDYATAMAQDYQHQALTILRELPDNVFRDAMAAIARLSVNRSQ